MTGFIVIEEKKALNTEPDETGALTSCKYFSFTYQGKIKQVECKNFQYFIIGYIQNNHLNSNEKLAEYLSQPNITEQIAKLNGHFSIISVAKYAKEINLYSNKSGGNRLYIKQTENGWTMSNNLKLLIESQPHFNAIAMKETVEYRWVTGEHSLISGIYQLPSSHHWSLNECKILNKTCYFRLPENSRNYSESIEALANKTDILLTKVLNDTLTPKKKVAILLSGGVDSSILAAIANKAGHELVAISHRSLQHKNPELETAIKFAQALNIEHRIIDIDDNQIAEAFKQTSVIIEQSPRFQSSIILYLLFAQLKGEFNQVIYGEAADTLFGNNSLKRYITRFNKKQRICKILNTIPFAWSLLKLAPKNKLSTLVNSNTEDYIKESNQLAINSASRKLFASYLSTEHLNYSFISLQQGSADLEPSLSSDLLKIKRFALDTDVDNHFHETGALAAYFGLDLVSPFVDIDIINFAANLSEEQTLTSTYVKPILRKVGEKYFKSELMYLPKKGFPAPHLNWLEGCLKTFVVNACNKMSIKEIDKLDPETQWTIAGLQLVIEELGIKQ